MKPLNKYIDHTILKPAATQQEVIALCKDAAMHDFASVCIQPCQVQMAKKLLSGTDVKICTVIGFPLGANTTKVKALETIDAYDNGCDEFDMVINVGALKDKRYEDVRNDIKAVVDAAQGRLVKVIIETFLLTDEEKIKAVELSCEAGAHFVKTCTGFSGGAASVEDIQLMKAHCRQGVQVKASAGIRDYASAKALIEAGADRLGTSAGMAIIQGGQSKEAY